MQGAAPFAWRVEIRDGCLTYRGFASVFRSRSSGRFRLGLREIDREWRTLELPLGNLEGDAVFAFEGGRTRLVFESRSVFDAFSKALEEAWKAETLRVFGALTAEAESLAHAASLECEVLSRLRELTDAGVDAAVTLFSEGGEMSACFAGCFGRVASNDSHVQLLQRLRAADPGLAAAIGPLLRPTLGAASEPNPIVAAAATGTIGALWGVLGGRDPTFLRGPALWIPLTGTLAGFFPPRRFDLCEVGAACANVADVPLAPAGNSQDPLSGDLRREHRGGQTRVGGAAAA
jgi:hypothetical protein